MHDQDTAQQDFGSAVGTSGYVNYRRVYFASCGCGWLETGWPNEAIARRSLNNHIATQHPRKQASLSS